MKRKKLSLAAIVLTFSLLVAACGNQANKPEATGKDGGSSKPATSKSSNAATTFDSNKIPPYKGVDSQFPNSYPKPKVIEGKKYVIGYMNIMASNEQLFAQQEAVVKEAKKFGMEVVLKDNQLDVNRQISDMEQLIAQKVDAIIYFPIDPKAIVRTVGKAKEAGIPVFAQDQTSSPEEDPGNIVSQVWQGRDTSAYYAVASVAQMKPGANVIGIGLNVPVPSIMFLMQQVEKHAKDLGLNWLDRQDSESDDASGGQKVMSQLLVKHKNVDAVIAYNDPNAQGAALALKDNNMNNTITAGFNGGSDAHKAVESGRQTISLKADAIGIGKQLTWGVYGYISGQVKLENLPKIVVVPPKIMTKENIATMKTWEEQLKEE